MTPHHPQPWRVAMERALYGEDGFYRSAGAPARHFRTSAHASPLFARAIHTLAVRVEAALGSPADFTLVDVGAGDGALLAGVADLAPAHWSLTGVDVAARPPGLPERVEWQGSVPDRFCGLAVASEYLDVVALDVVELTAAGPRLVTVTAAGEEAVDGAPEAVDAAWVERWWPLRDVGDRAEIGRPRDEAWRAVTATVSRGVAVAIDYAADPARDVTGTLTGYRDGRQVEPVPDGRGDLTAHVHFASLADPGDLVTTQRTALQSLGVRGDHPAYDDDPAAYLDGLATAGAAAELLDLAGLGGHTWLVHAEGDLAGPVLAGWPAGG